MTMDIDALVETQVAAESAEEARHAKHGMRDRYQIRRAGIRAVVEALRDELLRKEGPDTHNLSERIGLRVAVKMFNDILGGAGEKAAGGPTREDGLDDTATAEPAADPSPAVCEWRRTDESGYAHEHGWTGQFAFGHELPKCCHRCGKPIVFKEAK